MEHIRGGKRMWAAKPGWAKSRRTDEDDDYMRLVATGKDSDGGVIYKVEAVRPWPSYKSAARSREQVLDVIASLRRQFYMGRLWDLEDRVMNAPSSSYPIDRGTPFNEALEHFKARKEARERKKEEGESEES